MTTRIRCCAVLVLKLVLAGASLPSSAQNLTVRIGLVAPMSGPLSETGWANAKGARLAIDELNAKNLKLGSASATFELLAEDDAGDPRQAVIAAQKLVDSGIHGVVGHQTSGSTIPASRIYAEAGIPQISPFTTSPKYTHQGFKTAFRLIADDTVLGKALANYAVKTMGLRKLAVIDDRSAYGHGIAEEFSKTVIAAGGNVIRREYVSEKSIDFGSILTSVRAAQPEALFFGGMYATAGPMLRQMQQLGMPTKLLGGDGICDNELLKLAGDAIQDGQVYCAGPAEIEQMQIQEFKRVFRQRFGSDAQLVSAYSFDAVNLLADAMVRADSADPKKYLPFLAATRSYAGITGSISFDENGDLLEPTISLYTFRRGHRVLVATVPFR